MLAGNYWQSLPTLQCFLWLLTSKCQDHFEWHAWWVWRVVYKEVFKMDDIDKVTHTHIHTLKRNNWVLVQISLNEPNFIQWNLMEIDKHQKWWTVQDKFISSMENGNLFFSSDSVMFSGRIRDLRKKSGDIKNSFYTILDQSYDGVAINVTWSLSHGWLQTILSKHCGDIIDYINRLGKSLGHDSILLFSWYLYPPPGVCIVYNIYIYMYLKYIVILDSFLGYGEPGGPCRQYVCCR